MEKKDLAVLLQEHKKEIMKLAPKYVNPERMYSIYLEAVKNPKIRGCAIDSVLTTAKRMAEMGTEIVGAGGMWLVPFKSKSGMMILNGLPDWRLIIDKARRVKVIKHATAEAVYEKDVFSYERGLNPNLIHKPALSNRGNIIAFYCVYTLPDGTKDFAVMSIDEVDAIRERSKAKDSGPWVTDFAEMGKKTVIKRALKVFEGASPELTNIMRIDNEVMGYIDTPEIPISEPKALPEPEPAEQPEAPEPEPEIKPPAKKAPVKEDKSVENTFVKECADCGEAIDSKVAKFSESKFGKPLCRDCQTRQ
jgi:recombination protein RecT